MPCGTKIKTKALAVNPMVPTVTVNSDQDPATGYKRYFTLNFDATGKEFKTYGNLV